MKHVLHLASWYPNRKGPQDGDFIQRQLQALAAYAPVYVLAVVKDESLKPGSSSIDKDVDGNLFQTIAYYNGYKTGIKKLDTLLSLLAYQNVFRKLVKDHINAQGKPDLIHVHVAFRAGLIALWSAGKYKTPYVVSEHWSGYKKEDKSGFYFQPPAIRSFIKKILNGARAILPVSASLAEDIQKITTNTNFEVVHNVVDESLFSPPADKPSGKFRFLHVSTMGPEKQPEMLFRAFDALSDEKADLNKTEEPELNKTGEANLNKTGEANLNKTGEANLNKTGEASLTRTGEADMDETGETNLNKTGEANLNKTDGTDLNKTGEVNLNRTGEADLDETGEFNLYKTGEANLNKTGEANLNKTDGTDLNKTGEVNLNRTGEADLDETGEFNLYKTGEANLKKTGETKRNKNAYSNLNKNIDPELVCLGTVPDGLVEWVSKNTRHAANIIFLGNVPYNEVASQMQKADCLVITSLYETFSCVAAEALLSGLPVIATPVGIIPDTVTPENGLVVKNEEELISAMRQILANRNAYKPDLIADAQKGRFSYQNIGAKLVELYNNL